LIEISNDPEGII